MGYIYVGWAVLSLCLDFFFIPRCVVVVVVVVGVE